MNKLALFAASFIALVGSSCGLLAASRMQPLTSENWRTMCRASGAARVADARCQARLMGEIDGILVGMRLSHGKAWICMPDHVDAEVRREVVERYLMDHPEALSEQFGEGVAAALANAYPCQARK